MHERGRYASGANALTQNDNFLLCGQCCRFGRFSSIELELRMIYAIGECLMCCACAASMYEYTECSLPNIYYYSNTFVYTKSIRLCNSHIGLAGREFIAHKAGIFIVIVLFAFFYMNTQPVYSRPACIPCHSYARSDEKKPQQQHTTNKNII